MRFTREELIACSKLNDKLDRMDIEGRSVKCYPMSCYIILNRSSAIKISKEKPSARYIVVDDGLIYGTYTDFDTAASSALRCRLEDDDYF